MTYTRSHTRPSQTDLGVMVNPLVTYRWSYPARQATWVRLAVTSQVTWRRLGHNKSLICFNETVADFFFYSTSPISASISLMLCILTPHTFFGECRQILCIIYYGQSRHTKSFLIRAVYFRTILRIRILRIRMVLGLPYPNPDPWVRGTDPDPSII